VASKALRDDLELSPEGRTHRVERDLSQGAGGFSHRLRDRAVEVGLASSGLASQDLGKA